MKIKFAVIVLIWCFISSFAYAERMKLHSSERKYMNDLLTALDIKEDDFEMVDSMSYFKKYDGYIDIGNRYEKKEFKHGNLFLDVITDKNGYVNLLSLGYTSVDVMPFILKFKHLKVLYLSDTKLTKVGDLSRLKKLMFLNLRPNDNLTDLEDVKNLDSLVEIVLTSNQQVSIGEFKNLPRFERFIAATTFIKDITPLSNIASLKVLRVKMGGDTLDPIKKSKKLEELEIRSKSLRDVSVLSDMEKLKSLRIYSSDIEELELNENAVDLEEILIGGSRLKKFPVITHFKKLKDLTVYRTEIDKFYRVSDLPLLESLTLSRNKNLTQVGVIKNLPKLKKLELTYMPITGYDIGYLPSLKQIDLSGTDIKRLTGFENFPNLTDLDVYNTKLESIRGVEKAGKRVFVSSDNTLKYSEENEKVHQEMRERERKKLFN